MGLEHLKRDLVPFKRDPDPVALWVSNKIAYDITKTWDKLRGHSNKIGICPQLKSEVETCLTSTSQHGTAQAALEENFFKKIYSS